ncbi:hypothetical protein BST97_11580 [Nonlabens spongiae]|uniref:GmrSD restriction endonucleases N-terminal domain-containing protein n=1 Tax=Nonlabens spongiae TaxID=331648 RepID=A0A1W6MM41_9FLAO|nr:DUF262 domain-containing protein [Nonlabens spongiae]ARN78576.1 hypothetical protein BST97_11580 [Nonlabens spongiae]
MCNPVNLIDAIESKIDKVHTQSLDLSLNEILDMKVAGELNISPDYQRLFRWSEGSQSRFIESLLLEMPVPPIYVVEEEDSTYVLIDGLQRISSYLHFRGNLEADHLDPKIKMGDALTLIDCDIVTELNGKSYADLPTALQIRLKRSFVRVEVVRKGSNPKFKYHMFKRLNTGGVLLTDQQMRNCTIRLLDSKFNDFIIELAKNSDFKGTTKRLTKDQILGSFDHELVLRFFALKNWRENFVHDVRDFLTEYMEGVTSGEIEFDYDQNKSDFERTFKILNDSMSEKAFGYANKNKTDVTSSVGVYQFEAFSVGIQNKLEQLLGINQKDTSILADRINKIKMDDDFISYTSGGGKNSKGPLENRINFVRKNII